jgi:hypothetical protein
MPEGMKIRQLVAATESQNITEYSYNSSFIHELLWTLVIYVILPVYSGKISQKVLGLCIYCR